MTVVPDAEMDLAVAAAKGALRECGDAMRSRLGITEDLSIDDELVGLLCAVIIEGAAPVLRARVDAGERAEWMALRDADTLHMLPIEAHIASVRFLAERLIELTTDA